MKVALCFFGQPRFLDNPYSFYSHKYWIIDKYKTDIFVHTWISNKEIEFEHCDCVKNALGSEQKNSAEKILKKYNPKKFIFEPPIHFELENDTRELLQEKKLDYENRYNGSFNYTLNNEKNTLSQLYSISKSLSLLKDEGKYDWIILSRYDNYIFKFPNLHLLEKDNLYLNNIFLHNFSDVIIVGGQYQMETFICFDQIPELSKDIFYFCAEEYKRVAYQKYYPDINKKGDWGYQPGQERRISFGIGVVRSNSLENLQI